MKVKVISKKGGKMIAPVRMYSNGDWFKCQSCGYTVRMKVLGDRATCSQCGGRMERI